MQNYQQTIISQFAASPIICQLIANMNDYIDPTINLDSFYNNVWNVHTAIGYGLDVWGRIVGVNRVLNIPIGGKYLGFEEAGSVSADPFNNSPFYTGEPITGNYVLTDDGFRTLILAKAFANICDGSIPSINQILLTLFPGQGNCYCTDGQNMTMTYTFEFTLSPVDAAIVEQSGVLPRPCGVSVSVVQV